MEIDYSRKIRAIQSSLGSLWYLVFLTAVMVLLLSMSSERGAQDRHEELVELLSNPITGEVS